MRRKFECGPGTYRRSKVSRNTKDISTLRSIIKNRSIKHLKNWSDNDSENSAQIAISTENGDFILTPMKNRNYENLLGSNDDRLSNSQQPYLISPVNKKQIRMNNETVVKSEKDFKINHSPPSILRRRKINNAVSMFTLKLIALRIFHVCVV